MGRGDGGHGVLLTPPPLPTGILYSPVRSHQETKMAVRRTQSFHVQIQLIFI